MQILASRERSNKTFIASRKRDRGEELRVAQEHLQWVFGPGRFFDSKIRIESRLRLAYARDLERDALPSPEQEPGRRRAERAYWQAVIERNARWDGTFVFAVRSTGIYCRPSCPARRPGRRHVRFFAQPAEAERAGFRPCRRCRPEQSSPGDSRADLIRRVCQLIARHREEPLTLPALAAHVGSSPFHLQRVFKRGMGITPRQYADALRLAGVKRRLREGQDVTTALYAAGYGSSSRLYERAPAHLGMTPATYRRGGRGMKIAYSIVQSPLGRLLVGATARGLCAVSFGDRDGTLEAALRQEYPHAEIARNDSAFRPWIKSLLRHLRGHQTRLDLPLDIEATAFQRRVWEELQHIPYGRTRTYSQVARAIGQPTAVRAVARACATNPVSVVVPCHRVIRSDGSLGGYRWGLERKQALLAKERTK
jgi:AraC family transcriptional regulator of adaptative response/methylated-DNA-[protein]-cysteine methyltransferase